MVKWIVTATADYGVSYHSEVVEEKLKELEQK